jgi:hypothetical protein
MRTKLLTLCLTMLAALTARAADLDLTDVKDDATATARLGVFLKDIGQENVKQGSESVLIRNGGFSMFVYPTLSQKGGDLLVATITYKGVGKSNLDAAPLTKALTQANSRFNYVTAYLDAEGDLVLRYALVFDGRLEEALAKKWFLRIASQSTKFVKDHGETLKPYLAKK